jgi:hypothetical protein
MARKSKRQRWNEKELNELRKYILLKGDELKLAFYQNIIEGKIIYKKCSKFFIEMSKKIKRSSNQCKSKFQKMEREIYLEILQVPEEYYLLYQCQRKLNSKIKNILDSRKKLNKKPKHRSLRKIKFEGIGKGKSEEKTRENQSMKAKLILEEEEEKKIRKELANLQVYQDAIVKMLEFDKIKVQFLKEG